MLHRQAGQRVFSPSGLFSVSGVCPAQGQIHYGTTPWPGATVRYRAGVVMARLWHGILGVPPENFLAGGFRRDTLARMARRTRHQTLSRMILQLWRGLLVFEGPLILGCGSLRLLLSLWLKSLALVKPSSIG